MLPGLALSLLFTMMRAVPFLILERQVNFGWVGLLEFMGTLGLVPNPVTVDQLVTEELLGS